MKTNIQTTTPYRGSTSVKPLKSKLLNQVETRLGILPNFFLLHPDKPEITTRQWQLAELAYLDNPLPSLFKERLFVYLSSFFQMRYFLVRHVGFLAGLGYPSGDKNCPAQSVEEIIRLLQFSLPYGQELEPYLALCHVHHAPMEVFPEADTKKEKAIIACTAHVFLQTPDAAKSFTALHKLLGPANYNYLTLLLSFIRATNYWMELLPNLAYEKDVQALMDANEVLAGYLLKKPAVYNTVISGKHPAVLPLHKGTGSPHKEMSREYEALLEQNNALRKREQEKQSAVKTLEEIQQGFLLELLHDPVIVWNLSGTIIVWNRGAEINYGYTKAEAIGQPIHELLKTVHTSSFAEILQTLTDKGEWTGELSHQSKKGEHMIVESRKQCFYLKDQQFILETIHDITDKKLAEEALRKSEERLQLAASVTGFGIHDHDINDNCLYFSPELKTILGIPANAETDIKNCEESELDCIHPDDRELFVQNRQAAISSPGSNGYVEQSFRILRPDNETRWVYNRSQFTFLYENGERKPVRNTGVLVDITERKKAEERLLQSEEKYRTLFESIDEGFCIIEMLFDTDRKPVDYLFLEINPAFARNTGIEKVIGKRVLEIYPKLETYWFDIYGKVAVTGEPVRFENRAEQLHRFFDVYAFKVGDKHENKVAVLFTDISKRKIMEQHQEEFIGVASHELKTPVTSIKAYAEILREIFEERNDKNNIKLIQKLDAQVDRLTNLIRTLLDTTKIVEGHFSLKLESFNLNNLMLEKVEELQRLSSIHQLIWRQAEAVWILADRERLGQVLINLISNGIKYSPNGGDVVISCLVDNNGITVSVQDKGIGIPKEMQSKVFDRFYRVQRPQAPTFPGIGLGLYITAGIIQQHGGTIWVESNTDGGSTFFFTLPQTTDFTRR